MLPTLLLLGINNHLDTRQQSQHVGRYHAIPRVFCERRRVALACVSLGGCVPFRQLVAANGVHGHGASGSQGEAHRSSQTSDTDLRKTFKDVLMTALNAVESARVNRCSLCVQIGESVAFIDILFTVFLGKLRVLLASLSDLHSVKCRPEACQNQNRWR